MAFRIVMVKFIENITDKQITDFKDWLDELALNTPYLINMNCGRHLTLDKEHSLDVVSPNASFHDFVSMWEFEDESDLEKFIAEPFHREMAAAQFKKYVVHRHVVNIV